MRSVGLVVAAALLAPAPAVADEPVSIDQPVLPAGYFRVALCAAKPFNAIVGEYAFIRFGRNSGMFGHACGELAPGQRGMLTASSTGRGGVRHANSARVTLEAPPSTTFEQFKWGGRLARFNCLFEAFIQAITPSGATIPVIGATATPRCPRASREFARTVPVPGASKIVQRVACVAPPRRACSRSRPNYIRTTLAEVLIRDPQPPTLTVAPGPLTSGAWLKGTHELVYNATDNVGVRSMAVMINGTDKARDERDCAVARAGRNDVGEAFSNAVPCPSGPGRILVETDRLPEGVHDLGMVVADTAGNTTAVSPTQLRLDHTPPARVDVGVIGGEGWRPLADFAVTWTHREPDDRAPVVAAEYRLCPVGGSGCVTGAHPLEGVDRLAVQVPRPGEWTLRVWLRDAAGNSSEQQQSEPVVLRHDPAPPELSFEAQTSADPTLLSIRASDRLSGVASGSIEISRQGSEIWHTLPTTHADGHLAARVDDALLAPGVYAVRASAVDHAGNVAVRDRAADGQPLLLSLPLRTVTTLRAGVPRTRVTRVLVRQDGRRRVVRRRTSVVQASVRAVHGSTVRVAGQLVTAAGAGLPRAPVDVHAIVGDAPPRHVGALMTDAHGRFRHAVRANASQTLRLTYAGTAHTLPAARDVRLRVPAMSSLSVSRPFALNGQTVTFRGRVRTLPVPAGGKLVELQTYLSGRWQSFRTFHSDALGRWELPYEFRRTRGTVRFAFRVRLIREAGYPYETGTSRVIFVRVRGR